MNSRFLSRLADRLILRPSRNPIDPEGRRRERVSTPDGTFEVWVTSNRSDAGVETTSGANLLAEEVDCVALKFPGTAGRAERGGPHPFELFPELKVEIWTVNPIGYGGSDGNASLATTAASCEAVWELVKERCPAAKIFLIGNSLGCLSALYIAARKKVAGVYLRNPVPVQHLIAGRWKYNWWNLGLAGYIAKLIPAELNAVQNANRSTAPLLLVSSERDRVCPWAYQQMIWSNYCGSKKLIILKNIEHHERVPDAQLESYCSQTAEFLDSCFVS